MFLFYKYKYINLKFYNMKNIDRDSILLEAVENCYREMFAKAQPEANWDNLIAEYKAGKIDEKKDGPIYDRHYLSCKEYTYIIDKYLKAYRIESEWKDDIEVLEDYLKNGGSKDKYIEAHDDEYGYHPGYRGYEKVAPLKEHIKNIIDPYQLTSDDKNELTNEVVNKVFELIDTCKNFYRFNTDEEKFRNTLAFGATPTSNPETVKQWWRDHYNVEIEIEERIPKLFWYFDHGYTHEDLIDEFGEDYGEKLTKEWEDEKTAKKAEYEKLKREWEERSKEIKNNKKSKEENEIKI